jgi:hypothetical protein
MTHRRRMETSPPFLLLGIQNLIAAWIPWPSLRQHLFSFEVRLVLVGTTIVLLLGTILLFTKLLEWYILSVSPGFRVGLELDVETLNGSAGVIVQGALTSRPLQNWPAGRPSGVRRPKSKRQKYAGGCSPASWSTGLSTGEQILLNLRP